MSNERRIVPHSNFAAGQNMQSNQLIEVDPFGGAPARPVTAHVSGAGHHRSSAPPITLKSVLRYKWTILLVTLLIAAPIGSAIWFSYVPMFRANGEIHVSPVQQSLIYQNVNQGPPNFQNYINTQVSTILTVTVLNAVLDDQAVQTTNWHKQEKKSLFGGKLSRVERLKDALDVKLRGGTNIIDVAFTTDHPEESAAVVNVVLDKYLEHIHELARTNAADVTRLLDERKQIFEQEKRGFEETISSLKASLQGGEPKALLQTASIEVRQKEAQLDELTREKRLLKMQLEDLLDTEKLAGDGGSPESQPTLRYDDDPAWVKASDELRLAQESLDTLLSEGFSEEMPRVKNAQKKVAARQAALAAREKVLNERPIVTTAQGQAIDRPTPTSVRSRIHEIDRKSGLLRESLEMVKEDVKKLGDLVAMLEGQQRELDRAASVVNDIETRQTQRQVESGAPGSISIQAYAFAPSAPANATKRLMYVGMACFAGLAAGLLSAFLRASFTHVVADVDEVAQSTQSPFLGYLPWVDNPEHPANEEVALQAEAIRVVRTALLEQLRATGGQSILITSAGPAAGKTTMATQIALSLAACGKRVLLVDADLRRPAVSARLKIAGGPGLLAVLRGEVAESRNAIVSLSSTMHVLPASKPIETAMETEPLANGVFSKQLEAWRKEFDVIVFDAPPVLPVADASILARQVDGTIFVVREASCRRTDIADALSSLRSTGGQLFGTVVFGQSRRGRYGSSYYGGYYRPVGTGQNGLSIYGETAK